ncbi:MAG TPA: hypothetical protein PKZ76_03015 [Xanthomonadaceae bacterium]|nr:hypothetical protein [Xanthomonadaceae bacterium]
MIRRSAQTSNTEGGRMGMREIAIGVALLVAHTAALAQGRSPVGWALDPVYVEVETEAPEGEFRRLFVLRGETAEDWTERILIEGFPNAGSQSPSELLDQLAAEYREACPSLSDHRVSLPDELHQTARPFPDHAR